ncbi:MAG: hypothetical protein VKN72_22375 [Nostocales cyanobacterium 94392]|nr:hypothetical protein [Nostocales cyanobacterium 94392]
MFNSKQLLNTFLTIITVTSISLSFIPQTKAAQIILEQEVSWQNIIKKILGGEPEDTGRGANGGSRGDDFCLINPGKNEKVWHLRPLFIWQGDTNTIAVREKGKNIVLWRNSVAQTESNLKSAQYKGLPLQFGKSYDWLFYSNTSKNIVTWKSFQIMDATERAPITADLSALNKKLKAEGATEEEIALERANYFFKRKFWGDVLQELYSVKNPSAELQIIADKVTNRICKPTVR